MAKSVRFVLVLLVLSSSKADDVTTNVNVEVNLNSVYFTVSDRYLCVNIDSNAMRNHWAAIDLTTPIIVTLAKGISPVTVRVGGTSQQYAYFVPDSNTINQKYTSPALKAGKERKMKPSCMNGFQCVEELMDENFNVTTHDWDVLNEFVQKAGWELVYGLNSNIRAANGIWDSSNAEELVKYTMSKNYSLLAWELGNEPVEVSELRNSLLMPKSLSDDFQSLQAMLQQRGWPNIRLAGPDTASLIDPSAFFLNFLQATKPGLLYAATYHQYYLAAQAAKEDDFISISRLDGFATTAWLATEIVQELQHKTELWLGETASTYNGGTGGLSDVYIAGFMWLDKLGLAATRNHSKVFRQTFYGGLYSLTNPDGTPRPDYWLSVLYVRLVGPSVLSVLNGAKKGRAVRVYAHCVRPSDRYKKGGVVLYMLNLLKSEANVTLSDENLYKSSIDVYWLEPGDNNGLLSKQVSLNGQVVSMVNNLTLPELPPIEGPPTNYISLPSLSFGFIVFKDANASACMTS